MIRVLLADDHRLVRKGFRALLEARDFEVVAEADDGFQVEELARTVPFDVAVLDVSMPRMNGLDCAQALLAADPERHIVLLTMHTEEEHITAALRLGIRGYVCKTQASEELSEAIRDVASGGTYLGPRAADVLVAAYLSGESAGKQPLTLRERQVLQLVAEGSSTKDVAIALGLTTKTAESYRSRLMAKLDLHDTASLVRYALRHGVTELALGLVGSAITIVRAIPPHFLA